MNETLKIGLLVLSDRASQGVYEDKSGPAMEEVMNLFLTSPWEKVYKVIPDDRETIEAELKRMADEEGCGLILTSGGTGPSPRDCTPEATVAVCEKILPGFGEQMRAASLKKVPTAILSRAVAGIRGQSLVINMPGKPKAIRECLDAVFPAVPDCLNLIGAAVPECDDAVIKVHKPHH